MNHLDRPSTPSMPSTSTRRPVAVLPALRRIVMWATIGLACAVVVAYALFCPRAAASRHTFEVGPDPEMRPFPAAPVGPLPPEAALVASNVG
jgi:hypothetical protein